MSLLNRLNQFLQNPLIDTIASVYKKFKSSKSFYSVFYIVLVFTLQQAVAWQYGSFISESFRKLGSEWYYQLGAFVFEHGSWELVVLGIFIMLLLFYVKVQEDRSKNDSSVNIHINGDNHAPIVVGSGNTVLQNSTLIIHQFPKSIIVLVVAFVLILIPINRIYYYHNGISFVIDLRFFDSRVTLKNEYQITSKEDIRDIYNLDNIPNSQYKTIIDHLQGAKYTLSNNQNIIALVYDTSRYHGEDLTFEKFIKDSLPISDKKRTMDTHTRVMYDLTTLDNDRYLILYEAKQNRIYQLIMPINANQNVDNSKDLLKSFKIK